MHKETELAEMFSDLLGGVEHRWGLVQGRMFIRLRDRVSDLDSKVGGWVVSWVDSRVSSAVSSAVVGEVGGADATPSYYQQVGAFDESRISLNIRRVQTEERKALLRLYAREILTAALSTDTGYISERFLRFITYTELNEVISFNRMRGIRRLLEKEKVLYRDDKLRSKGLRLDYNKARGFIRR